MNNYSEITDYQLLQKCGRGAYGDVFIASDIAGNRVALKIVDKATHASKEFDGLKFYCSRCADSQNLIKIFHVGETESYFYYTMELADNCGADDAYKPTTLASVIHSQGALKPEEVRELGLNLLAGLSQLHEADLVHRDIKPENIIYVNDIPQLSDIGLVSSVTADVSLKGTLGFIPPEKLKTSSSSLKSGQDDLYSLGMVLYCALTGNPPDKFPSISKDMASCSEYKNLNYALLIACSKNSSLRFKSISEFSKALETSVPSKRRIAHALWNARFILLIFFISIILGSIWFVIKTQPVKTKSSPAEQLIFKDNFNTLSKWRYGKSPYNGFKTTPDALTIGYEPINILNFREQLPEGFILQFDIDYTHIHGKIYLRLKDNGLKDMYRWELGQGKTGYYIKMEIRSGLIQNKDYAPIKTLLPSTSGFQSLKIMSTKNHVSLLVNNKLVGKYPRIFTSGTFSFKTQTKKNNSIIIKDFQLIQINQRDI
jgi:serine/threonine protein kinase